MIKNYKNRKIDYKKKVWIYRNLRRKLYSIRQSNRIVAHTDAIMLKNAEFKVNEAGRKRVLEEKRKNVHAFVIGYIIKSGMATDKNGKLPAKIIYNPYKNKTFVHNLTEKNNKVHSAWVVILNNKYGCTGAYLNVV